MQTMLCLNKYVYSKCPTDMFTKAAERPNMHSFICFGINTLADFFLYIHPTSVHLSAISNLVGCKPTFKKVFNDALKPSWYDPDSVLVLLAKSTLNQTKLYPESVETFGHRGWLRYK